MYDAGLTRTYLVHYIVLEDLALVACDNSGHMVLDDGSQSGAVIDVVDPSRQLGMPEQSMASNKLAVRCGPINNLISIAPVERST